MKKGKDINRMSGEDSHLFERVRSSGTGCDRKAGRVPHGRQERKDERSSI